MLFFSSFEDMTKEDRSDETEQYDRTRRNLLYTGSALAAYPLYSGVVGATDPDKDVSSADFDDDSDGIDILYEDSEYRIAKSEWEEDTYYLRETPEGTIQLYEPDVNTTDTASSDNEVATADSEEELATALATTSDDDWRDYVANYEIVSDRFLEMCDADDDYGYHYVRGFRVDLTGAARGLASSKVAALLEYLFDQAGIPEFDTAISMLAGAIVGLSVAEFAAGGVDNDGWFDFPETRLKLANSYDDAIDDARTVGTIPGMHVKSSIEY